MTATLDERTVWRLLRALGSVEPDRDGIRYAYNDPSESTWLQVYTDGAWEVSGALDASTRDLLDLFIPLQVRRALVIAQIGQSLDGRIATASGHSHYVTGRDDIRRLHRLRAVVDAVLVGAGTVIADDPSLTVREVEGPNPVRVVVDPRGRTSGSARLYRDGAAHTIRILAADLRDAVPDPAADSTVARPMDGLPDELRLPSGSDGRIAPSAIVDALGALGLRRLLFEGWAATVSGFLDAGALDRLHVTVAPIIIGSGPIALDLRPIDRMDEAMRPRARRFDLGEDSLYDLELR